MNLRKDQAVSEPSPRRPLLVAADDPCQDVRCSRVNGRCVGMHCGNCGEPSSSQGHYTIFCSAGNRRRTKLHFCCPDGRCELNAAVREGSHDDE